MRRRIPLFFALNFLFIVLVVIGSVAGVTPNPRWSFAILLFAICTHIVVDCDGWNGRYAPLAIFMFVYFITYGVLDFTHLFVADDLYNASNALVTSTLSKPEAVILTGGIMLALGYRIAAYLSGRRPQLSARDWPKMTTLVIGLALWVVGTAAVYHWNVYIVADTTVDAERRGLANTSSGILTFYQLAQYAQPLGLLLIIYAWTAFPGTFTMLAMIVALVGQFLLGFVIDVRGMAMLGIVLLILAGVLIHGRIPWVWLAAGVAFVILVFPILSAYRTVVVHNGGAARSSVVQNIGEVLRKSIASEEKVNSGRERAQSFLERSNLKQNVEVIVEKAGDTVRFQHGHTMSPILFAFVPKILWSGKDQFETGRLLNKEFKFADNDDVFISPSHLGDLYWNFGWSGVVVGMLSIGLICGWVGCRFNLAEYRTVTRALVLIITMKEVIVGFEGSIDGYVVWLRSLAGIGLLHLLFARIRVFRSIAAGGAELAPQVPAYAERLYPNLLT